MPTPDDQLVILGRAIREVRNRLDLSQEALADAARLHPNVVSRLERGTNARLGTFLAAVNGLGVPLSEVVRVYEERLPGGGK